MSKNNSRSSTQKRMLKKRLAQRRGWICQICKCPVSPEEATLDHIKRQRDGGRWNINNLRLTHYCCNQIRH